MAVPIAPSRQRIRVSRSSFSLAWRWARSVVIPSFSYASCLAARGWDVKPGVVAVLKHGGHAPGSTPGERSDTLDAGHGAYPPACDLGEPRAPRHGRRLRRLRVHP